jgi:hypothetical protein
MTLRVYYVLASGRTKVYHGPSCLCLRMHGPYNGTVTQPPGLRACGYCGGK